MTLSSDTHADSSTGSVGTIKTAIVDKRVGNSTTPKGKNMFCLTNLVSSSIRREEPWKFQAEVPEIVRKDKNARSAWITNSTTKWNVYSLVEGLNENARVTKSKSDEEGNPPYKLHGLVADFDAPISDSYLESALAKFPYSPNHVERTLSGNLRVLWLFEEAIMVPSEKFLKYFLRSVLSVFPVHKMLPAFDEGAWLDCARYYTNSCQWQVMAATPIPADRVRGWLVEIGTKFDWTNSDDIEIPFENLRPALRKAYPRFCEWPGEFALNEQGPSFWIENSVSPMSAIVRETGIQTFSAHATKGFYTWANLLGQTFVNDYRSDSLGQAVKSIYHDGRHYFRQLPNGSWRGYDKGTLREHLRVSRGVCAKPDSRGISNVDRALEFIHQHQSVKGCGPVVFRPTGLIQVDGLPVLNTNTGRVLAPGPTAAPWGETGGFPFISAFLDGFFDPIEQKEYFLSWLAYFYRSGYEQNPRSGQNVFIAGVPNVGKTFLSQGIVGGVVGNFVEAQDWLLGDDNFGSELFEAPLWTIDDAVFTTQITTKRRFSEAIKKMAANRYHRCHEKFRMPVRVEWQGRIIVTCNRDEESIRAIPDLSVSILDKLMLFRAADKPAVKFLTQEQMEALLKKELPHLARYLLAYQIPEHCRGEARFGVPAYHEASLIATAERSSLTSGFLEILEAWKKSHAPDREFWEGSAYDLQKEILEMDQQAFVTLKSYGGDVIGRQLSALKNKGHKIECSDGGNTRLWKIFFDPDQCCKPPTAATAKCTVSFTSNTEPQLV
jgi:hypothetical protein